MKAKSFKKQTKKNPEKRKISMTICFDSFDCIIFAMSFTLYVIESLENAHRFDCFDRNGSGIQSYFTPHAIVNGFICIPRAVNQLFRRFSRFSRFNRFTRTDNEKSQTEFETMLEAPIIPRLLWLTMKNQRRSAMIGTTKSSVRHQQNHDAPHEILWQMCHRAPDRAVCMRVANILPMTLIVYS